MISIVLANLVLLLHFAFIVFVTVGVVLVFRWPRLVWIHIPCVVWGVWMEFQGWICPLTPLENRLRRLGGDAGYAGGFIEHYLVPIIYLSGLTRRTQILLGITVLIINVAGYGLMTWRRRLRTVDGEGQRRL